MKIEIFDNYLTVTKEATDKNYYGSHNAKGESKLLHAIKKELFKQGYDLIKKRMHKDGHLVDDIQQYLRTRKKGAGIADIYIYNSNFAISDAALNFNKGVAVLTIVRDVFK